MNSQWKNIPKVDSVSYQGMLQQSTSICLKDKKASL